MRPLILGILGLSLAGLAAIAVFQYRASIQLRSEIDAVARENREIPVLQREHDRLAGIDPRRARQLREKQDEISRIHAQIVAWRAQLATLETNHKHEMARAKNPTPASVSPAPGMIAIEAMRNVGRASPLMAMQTGMWAQYQGDVQGIMESVFFDADGKAKLDAIFSELPTEERVNFRSAERLAAMLVAETAASRGGPPVQFTERSQSGDTVEVAMQVQLSNGQIREARVLSLRLFPDGWKVMLPAQEAEMLKSFLNALPPAQRRRLSNR